MSKHPKTAVADHPVLNLIAQRFSPYAFDPRPIEREKLLSCLEAARWAPSSYNEQPWTYILAERTNPAEFAKAVDCLVEPNQAWAQNAGALILTVASRKFTRNGNPNSACEHDLGLAAGNLSLQAVALGLQIHQMIGIVAAKVRAAYGVPDGYDPLTAIAIGYAADVPAGTQDPLGQRDLAPRSRKKLSEFVVSTWGQPAKLS
ncbi:MAG: nitroreductase family protein [Pirellulaceae bacterium]|nr:nitroreductase family protein [Pirellulaceae bacterium]